jgi:hypothetical protein
MSSIKKGIYRHFKGTLAEVVGEAKHSETGEIYIAYYHKEKETSKMKLWVRPKKMFLEEVEVNGKKVLRFEFIKKK